MMMIMMIMMMMIIIIIIIIMSTASIKQLKIIQYKYNIKTTGITDNKMRLYTVHHS
jgi:hypothetical protein